MSKHYDRDRILSKLMRMGFKPQFKEKTRRPIALTISSRRDIGIKVWGYLDFLRIPVIRKEFKRARQKKQSMIVKYYYFRWFATKEEVNSWIKLFKKHFEHAKVYVNTTERNDFRVQAEIIK